MITKQKDETNSVDDERVEKHDFRSCNDTCIKRYYEYRWGALDY